MHLKGMGAGTEVSIEENIRQPLALLAVEVYKTHTHTQASNCMKLEHIVHPMPMENT